MTFLQGILLLFSDFAHTAEHKGGRGLEMEWGRRKVGSKQWNMTPRAPSTPLLPPPTHTHTHTHTHTNTHTHRVKCMHRQAHNYTVYKHTKVLHQDNQRLETICWFLPWWEKMPARYLECVNCTTGRLICYAHEATHCIIQNFRCIATHAQFSIFELTHKCVAVTYSLCGFCCARIKKWLTALWQLA